MCFPLSIISPFSRTIISSAFLTVEKVRVRANISDTQNKKWLSFLGVKDGNIFKANYNA